MTEPQKRSEDAIVRTELAGLTLRSRGKVRDLYEVDGNILLIATDRISAFDCVLPNGIPNKGRVLTALSKFWFDFTEHIIPNHVITADAEDYPASLRSHLDILRGRSMLVKMAKPYPVECVVRGYLAGSAVTEYRRNGSVCGIKLPSGLQESERLPDPIFTPATKAESGHDINISHEEMADIIGKEKTELLIEKSLGIFNEASEYASSRGLILSDTKFEFGEYDGETIMIDELLTPDSSRYWLAEGYEAGKAQINFDKQYIRDYLETLDWDKAPPAPELPPDVVARTEEKYKQAYKLITGKDM